MLTDLRGFFASN